MRQGPKVAIPLRPPSSGHWNIDSDLIFGIVVDTHRRRYEAKKIGQDPQQEFVGAEESSRQAPAPEGVSLAIAGSSQAASLTETACQEERDLEIAWGAIRRLHAVCLQTMHNMGCVREVEQAVVSTLMVEFARLQAILGEDLTQSLSALRSELEASSEALSADMLNILNLHPGDPGFSRVKELLQKHHQSVSLKVNLPLIELEAAKEDLNRFLQECLRELGSGPQVQEELGEIARRLLGYNRRVTEIINAIQVWSDLEYSTGLCSPWLWNSLWRRSFCQGSWMDCPRGSACQLQVWLIHLHQLERECLNDGQSPLGRQS